VPEYKRLTLGHGKSDTPSPDNLETPIVMASNTAEPVNTQPSETPVAPQAQTNNAAPPVNTEPAPPSASQSAQQAGDLAKENPAEYMKIFEKVVSSLPESERDVFIKGQLDNMKELERVNQELEASKKNEEHIKGMQKDNIHKTMNAIRNFFLQGADEEQKTKDLTKMETLFEQHPELHHTFAPVISCAAQRVEVAESTTNALKVERERSQDERELFNRMRGIARDSAAPTYVSTLFGIWCYCYYWLIVWYNALTHHHLYAMQIRTTMDLNRPIPPSAPLLRMQPSRLPLRAQRREQSRLPTA
tara:strand:- start:1245 stop:2153 length:909 start_codon:yes stop_codon:yes gene_type:complete